MLLALEFQPSALWIGLKIQPAPHYDRLDIWLCLLPMLPLLLSVHYPVNHSFLERRWWLDVLVILSGGCIYEEQYFVSFYSKDHLYWFLMAYGFVKEPELDDIPF